MSASGGEGPWVLSGEGELKGIDGLCLWIGPSRHEARKLSVEASGKQVDCVSTLLPIGQPEELRIEFEIRGVLPPTTEKADPSVLDRCDGMPEV